MRPKYRTLWKQVQSGEIDMDAMRQQILPEEVVQFSKDRTAVVLWKSTLRP